MSYKAAAKDLFLLSQKLTTKLDELANQKEDLIDRSVLERALDESDALLDRIKQIRKSLDLDPLSNKVAKSSKPKFKIPERKEDDDSKQMLKEVSASLDKDIAEIKSLEAKDVVMTAKQFLTEKFGDSIFKGDVLTGEGFGKLIRFIGKHTKRQGGTTPWHQAADDECIDSVKYSMFPLTDELSWKYATEQETQLWNAKELRLDVDREKYPTLPQRYKEMYADLLGFFQPGDGLISYNVLRFAVEAKTYGEMMMTIVQLYIEFVHAESYGMSVTSVIPDEKDQKAIFAMINELPCVKRKAEFIKKYINSGRSKVVRYVASACSEGVFFVTLFAIIFYFKSKNVFPTFITLNQQVAKDETLHRDFYCAKAQQYDRLVRVAEKILTGKGTEEDLAVDLSPLGRITDLEDLQDLGTLNYKEVLEIVEEAVEIEIGHMKYIMRKPIDDLEVDAMAGMTIENLAAYARLLGDQILIYLGLPIHFHAKCALPHMDISSISLKGNFYEVMITNYNQRSIKNALNWRKQVGMEKTTKSNAVKKPKSVAF